MTLARVSIPSPNYSSRGGAKVRLIVLHTAEGATTIESLGSYFGSSSSQVSSHTGADDKVNTVGEYVARGNKAWTAANANPVAVQIEMCAFAAWDANEWSKHQNMLNNVAQWIKEESAAFGIPIVKLSASQAQGGGAGVCQHRDLGSWGGNHSDCGNGFPIDQVLAMASGGAPAPVPPPTPSPSPGGPAPAFPWPSDNYIGPPSSDPKCHSGHYGPPDSTHVATWQQQMLNRGWSLSGGADGDYGPSSQNACRQFQQEKGLSVDGLVGPQTWSATWTAPIT